MSTTTEDDTDLRIPDAVARAAVLPGSYLDEAGTVYPALEWLRSSMPLGQAHLDGYDPLWLVTRFDDIMAVERDAALFNATWNNPILNMQAGDEFIRSLTGGTTRTLDALPFMDPPEHSQIKALTSRWFAPRNTKRFEDRIRAIAREDVEKMLDLGDEFDWVQDFALYYPLRVMMGLFGVPLEDMPEVLAMSNAFFGVNESDDEAAEVTPDQEARQFQSAIEDFFAYFRKHTALRRENPTEDLMSVIANAQVDGEYLPDSYVNGLCIQVTTAGHDTTSTTLAGGALAMARDPQQFQRLRADHSKIKGFVEESVRWVSPVKHFTRTASRDTELNGTPIAEGERLMLFYASGNRDEQYFENAGGFDMERSPNRHLGFGFGAHGCIGLHIARQELNVMWQELLPKIKKIELADDPTPLETNFVTSYKRMPVKITKA